MDHYFYHSLNSTIETANHFITNNNIKNECTTITAKQQINGRGKESRNWSSIPGNLHSSIVLRVSDGFFNIQEYIPFISPISITKSLNLENYEYKWPNDILIGGLKFCGILSQKNLDYIIISFGINLIDSPENINSTNLFKEKFLNDDLNINKNQLNDWIKNINILLENIIENLKYFYKICIDSGFSTIKNIWLKNCYNLNQEISLFYKGKIESGRFIGIGEYGEIILQKNNTILKISSAEIISN